MLSLFWREYMNRSMLQQRSAADRQANPKEIQMKSKRKEIQSISLHLCNARQMTRHDMSQWAGDSDICISVSITLSITRWFAFHAQWSNWICRMEQTKLQSDQFIAGAGLGWPELRWASLSPTKLYSVGTIYHERCLVVYIIITIHMHLRFSLLFLSSHKCSDLLFYCSIFVFFSFFFDILLRFFGFVFV